MASPLSAMRRYQFAFFVFFGVLLMIVFVVGDSLSMMWGSRGGGGGREEDTLVVTWRGGEMRERELGYTQVVRNIISQEFLRKLLDETYRKNRRPKIAAENMLTMAPSEQAIIFTRILAQKAKAIGIEASDEAAMLYLEQLSGDLIPRAGIGQMFAETVGNRINEQQLLDEIKLELLAQSYLQSINPSGVSQMPAVSWEAHRKLHRGIKAEVLPIHVASFVDKVTKQPTDAEITALFDASKNFYPEPSAPEPGFRRERKAAFEFVRADRQKLEEEETAKAKPLVTAAEIDDYYAKNKTEFQLPDEPPAKPADPVPTKPEAPLPAATPDPAKPADAPKPEEKKAEPAALPETKPELKKTEEKKSDSAPPDAAKPESAPPDSSCNQDPAAEKSAVKSPESPAPAAPAEAPLATESKPAATATPPAGAGSPAAPPAANVLPSAPVVWEAKYKPLDDKLREEIREKLAKQKASQIAQERIDKGFKEVKKAIEQFDRDQRAAKVTKKPAPTNVDLAKLAAEHGLTAGSIPLSDPTKVQETELGKTQGYDFSSRSFDPVPFHRLAYRDGISLWKPEQIQGKAATEGAKAPEFLYWKTAEEEPFEPKLADIRDEVIAAWKLREALPLAETEAKSLVEKVKASGKSLKETLADKPELKVVETNQFTWMTRGWLPANMGGAPTLSAVDHVEHAGVDFMKAVFALKASETGIALNHPKKIVYIVRIVSESPSEETLRDQFLQTGASQDVMMISNMEARESQREMVETLRRDLDLQWIRDPQS